jgi:hypothetical protein
MVSANSRSLQRSQQRGFAMRFCCEWTKDALIREKIAWLCTLSVQFRTIQYLVIQAMTQSESY